ncbi:hypothetical protein JB92DRAFT_2969361 [Gautieria morchelliformis]|nr:hypothetical protein JB92DRAFT_2969361 [Gautieria morchelliformis]
MSTIMERGLGSDFTILITIAIKPLSSNRTYGVPYVVQLGYGTLAYGHSCSPDAPPVFLRHVHLLFQHHELRTALTSHQNG